MSGRAMLLALCLALVGRVAAAAPPLVTGIDLVSPHRLPEERVRAAIGPLSGRPRLRGEVRESIVRLWALGLFSEVRVEEVPEPGGVRLRYVLARRPHVGTVDFQGDLELDVGVVAEAAGLVPGTGAEPARLEAAQRRLLDLYEREGFLQARVAVESEADPATNARDVVVRIDAGERARVGGVRVLGADRLSAEFVEKAFGIDAGDRIDEAAVQKGVEAVEKRYRDRGFFSARVEVRRALDRGRNQVQLDLVVDEGQHTRIEFEGVRSVDERRLRERLTFADTRVVDEPEVRASALQVAARYRELGFPFAEVTGRLIPGRDDVVRFEVDEGARVHVEAVDIVGSPLPERDVREALGTQERGLLTRGWFRRDQVEGDAEALAALLRARGYPDATVAEPRIVFSDDRTQARVTFTVEPGQRVEVGEVRIVGDPVVPFDELRTALPGAPGTGWSERAVQEGRRVIERRFAQRGYLAAEVQASSGRRNGVADVTYRVTAGPQTRVGRVLVGGLVQTREDVVRRELPFRPGDPFNPEALVEAQRRLGEVAVFERVDVEPLRPSPVPFADVTVTVRERKPWHLDLGIGYTTFEGARAFGEIGHDNVFGRAHSLALRQRISQRGDRTDLLYGVPWLLGTRWRGNADLFRERFEQIGYDQERYGLLLGVQRPLFEELIRGLRVALRYEISEVNRFDVDPTLLEEDVEPGRQRIATLTPEVTLDRRDVPLDPGRGSFHLVSVRGGGSPLGGEADFIATRLETYWFLDWLPPTVLVVSARLGLAEPLADDETLPIEERFFAGGAATVRGYRERRLGPLDARGNPAGGNGLAVFNVEWRFPIWRWFGGAVFFDTGAVTAEVEDLAPDQLRSGVGAGLRLSTPVGPVRLDVGYPLDRVENQEQKVRVYLTIGHPF
jgi:outer membrane protein insertion porin family